MSGCWETRYLYTLKGSSHKALTNNKGKHSNFPLERSSVQSASWVERHSNIMCLFDCDGLKGKWHLLYKSTASISYLNLVMREHQTNSNWGTFYKIIDRYSSKVSRSKKKEKEQGNVPHWDRSEYHVNVNFLVLTVVLGLYKMLISGETGWRLFINSLYYFLQLYILI